MGEAKEMEPVATFAAAVLLTAVQLLPHFLQDLPERKRRRLHSAAGGVAVAFVFLHLLPEIGEVRDPVSEAIGPVVPFGEHRVFVLVLAGLVGFYGIEIVSRRAHRQAHASSTWVDQVAIGVFAAYYAVVGYLLWRQADQGAAKLAAYTIAIGLHFLVVDYGLRDTHRQAYARVGRWVLAAAVVVGWVIGWVATVPEWGLGMMLAVFAGALILVALKEELPAERSGHYGAFVIGVLAYSGLLAIL